jgi:hypothetical protein
MCRGGCGRREPVDMWVMAADTDDSERVLEAWQAGRVERAALYEAVDEFPPKSWRHQL